MAFNRHSAHITQGVSRSPKRSMFYALGYRKEDFDKPMIGIDSAMERELSDFIANAEEKRKTSLKRRTESTFGRQR
jgi:dihydroxyacid dehydratase/phosphogluconate dehydratase